MYGRMWPKMQIESDGTFGFPEDEIYTVMQFTGLLDKNGKEIYEGDVVKDEYSTREIVFHMPDGVNNIYGFTQREISYDGWIGLNRVENDFEIIGNIYENSDLLSK